jgi:predicted house-cleaning NTP pyrophosphatase (Maf/HAM1 superfamily)
MRDQARVRRSTICNLQSEMAYGIQEQAGIFVSRVSGCLLNVVGLPVPLLLRMLEKSGGAKLVQDK